MLISHRFFILGRSIYGRLFGGSKPGLKPPSPSESPSSPTSRSPLLLPGHSSSSSSTARKFSFSSSKNLDNPSPSCVIDMTGTGNRSGMDNLNPLSGNNQEDSASGSVSAHKETKISSQTQTTREPIASGDDYDVESVTDNTGQSSTAKSTKRQASPSLSESTKAIKHDVAQRLRETQKRLWLTTQTNTNDKFTPEALSETCNEEAERVAEEGNAKKQKLSKEESEGAPSSAPAEASKGKGTSKSALKSKKKRSKKKKEGGQADAEGMAGRSGRPPPPNYFIAVQITNPAIISKVAEIQKCLSEKPLSPPWCGLKTAEIFKDAMVSVKKLHFTLHVMHLKDDEALEKAHSAFAECCSEVNQEFVDNPLDLQIEGLGHFRNSVIFAQIKDEESISRLTQLANIFKKKFSEICHSGDPRPFKAHMTIGKLSRSTKFSRRKIRSFPPDIMSDCEETHFGIQRVAGVQLLAMAGEDRLTGYYRCLAQHNFQTNPVEIVRNPDTASGSQSKPGEDHIEKT